VRDLGAHPERYARNENENMRKDGSRCWLAWSNQGIQDEAGNCVALLCVGTDITERKRAEEALTSERTLLRTLMDLLPTLIFVKDREGRFLVANAACAHYMGLASPQELIGKTDADFYPPEVAAGFRADERKVLEGTPLVDREEEAALPGGTRRFLLTNKVPLRGSGGNIIGLVGTCLDITERRRAEAEKEKLEAQFQQAQKMETVGRLAGGVAHDFNNMLQAILSHVDLALADAPPGSALRESIEEIQKSAQRSAALVRQLLAFARKQAIAPRVLDLNETVEGLLKLLHRLIGENIQLSWVPGAGLGPVKLDPTQVDQVLANLCVNARDAIGGVGKITIETGDAFFDETYCIEHPGFLPGAYVRLAVSDTGCGMDKATQAQIFEPFFTTKDVGEGTGLGLATVYGIVKQNHGFIHVYSEPGKGTTFSIYLPRHTGQAVAPQTKGAANLRRSTGETVLLVEDEPSILAIAQKVLDRLGYTVLAAATPGQALQLAEAHAGKIHLLMTDVVMPEMNGRDLARELLARKPETKCLFMSGYAADVIVHQGVIEKGVHFIQKPFTMADLAAKVRETLEQ
jgi:two-component system, cell cycle sensor histidine kinase and response regulator CckA